MTSFLDGLNNIGTSKQYHTDDACRSYREESRKKDEIIQQLCKINPNHGTKDTSVRNIINPRPPYNEVAALQVKIDKLEDKLRSKQNEIDSLNEKNAITRKEKEMCRLEAEKLDNDNRKLTNEKLQFESKIETFESLKYRSDYSIKLLQEQYQQSQSRVAELETRIKCHAGDREKLDHGKSIAETKHQHLLISLAKLVSVNDFQDCDAVLSKLEEMSEQNAILNGKVQSAEHKVLTAEEDAKNARETIVKLMRDYEGVGVGKENLRETKNKLETENTDLINQVKLMENRIESLTKLYDSSKAEIEDNVAKLLEMEVKLKEQEFSNQSSGTVFKSLLESLAAMLSTPFIPCQPTESGVKDKVQTMVKKLKEHTAAAEILDQRILQLQKQFESQYETGKQMLDKSRDSDSVKQELETKIKNLENDLAAQEVLKDNLKCDKERISRQIFSLADTFQLDYLPSDTDTIGIIGLLSERCQELMQNSPLYGGWKCPRCTNKADPSGSQKHAQRITSLKEELEAKQLQIQLLERRLASSETSNPVPLSCRGSETSRDRVHRLQHQLDESQMEIEDLRRALVRSQASEFELHQHETFKQSEELEKLSSTIEKLDKVRQKQAKKIINLKSIVEDKDKNLHSKLHREKDLKQARHLLEDTRRRELELIEFRDVIAQLLGVDVRCSQDPIEEIKMRLQRLLNMAQTSSTTPFTPYYMSQELGPAFQNGYNKVSQPAITYPDSSSNCRLHPSASVSFDNGHKSQSAVPNFQRRQQLSKNKIGFQFNNNKTITSSKRTRARSTSPGKVDDRKY